MKKLVLLFLSLGLAFSFAAESTPAKQTPPKKIAKKQSVRPVQEKSKKAAGKFATRCNEDLNQVKSTIPVTSYLANVTWAEAEARAKQLERFEQEMPKSDMLPYFAEACSLYVELLKLYTETDRIEKNTEAAWQERQTVMEEIEKTQNAIAVLRKDSLSALQNDLLAAKNQTLETQEEMKEREAHANAKQDSLLKASKEREATLLAQASAREDSLLRASKERESELEKALAEERAKAEARQKEAKSKLNELQSKLIQVTQDARGIILSMSDILFDVNKASLKQDLKTSLAKVAGILSVYQELNVLVEGHTDNTGSEKHNMKLSEQRAKNVMDFLVSQGIDVSRLTSKGYGMTRPVGDNKTKDGRQKNRRVDLVIQDKVLLGK